MWTHYLSHSLSQFVNSKCGKIPSAVTTWDENVLAFLQLEAHEMDQCTPCLLDKLY